MCGIAGTLSYCGQAAERDVIRRMTDSIAHRGPDSEGIWTDGPVGLGHRRLSIIDLSERSAQPMVSATGAAVITFNGEIYNYRELTQMLEARGVRFATHSDTEVILRLYETFGHECLEHLRGMFAFAIWDCARQELFLARDRVGIKPLYYLDSGSRFVFGSEIKAILASGYSARRIDRQALLRYMRLLVVPQPTSIIEDIRKLDPGAYLVVDAAGNVRKHTYWDITNLIGSDTPASEQACLDQLHALLRESVGYHMVADVPVGAFLSGGLDSSSVVAMMRAQAPTQSIETFSITFPQFPEYDEGRFAQAVADQKHTRHNAGVFGEHFLDDFDAIAWHLDEPFAISSAYASYYLARTAAQHTKVVLTGDGGDELFAGYEGYKNGRYLGPAPPLRLMLGALYHTAVTLESFTKTRNSALYRLLARMSGRVGSEGLRYSQQVAQNGLYPLTVALDRGLYLDALRDWSDNTLAHYYDILDSEERLTRKLYSEYKTRLVDEMLMKVDRMTMAHSLEARVPLLDHKVVEHAFAMPADLKLRATAQGQEGKYALKKVAERYLPHDIIYRGKQGFNIPVGHWLQGKFLDRIRERIAGGYLVQHKVVTAAGVDELLARAQDRRVNYVGMLTLLAAFETWAGVYSARFGSLSF